jgi:hypothetical protein
MLIPTPKDSSSAYVTLFPRIAIGTLTMNGQYVCMFVLLAAVET